MTRRIALLLTLATQLSCSPNLAQEPAATFQARVDSATAATDTARLAELAESRCRSRGDSTRTCYEDYFLRLADSGRVRLALGALERLGASDHDVEADGHGYTHVIGIRAWKPGDDVATVFRSCTPLYQSGCFHGVIQSYLTATGEVDSARAAGLCETIMAGTADNWLRFQCMHGMGHGLEMAWNWDLPRALRGCDWMPTTWDRESCYGGAIMENAVASQPGGHHTAVRALEQTGDDHGQMMEHGGHMMSGPPAFKMRDSTDALYPCDALDARYQWSCYLGHAGILLGHVGWDWGAGARECDRIDESMRPACYISLGTMASGSTVRDPKKSLELCAKGDRDWRQWCYVGVVKNFIDVTAAPTDGVAFCRDVPAGQDQDACWKAVGEEMAVLYTSDLDARDSVCAATGSGEAKCRQGAGLWEKP